MASTHSLSRKQLQDAATHTATSEPGLRTWLQEKVDPALFRPEAAQGMVISRLESRQGEYYVLKNPLSRTYFRLGVRDHFLWQQMDGSRTIKDLVVAYYLEYGAFAFARVATLVGGLQSGQFLTEKPVRVYQQVRLQLLRRQPGHRLNNLWRAFLQKEFALRGLDGIVTGVYRRGGWLLYTRPLQLLFLVLCVVGLAAFVQALRTGGYGVVTIGGSIQWGIVGLIFANLVAIFGHEMAHALTVKHYGREVRRGGFMIYFGLPAFFVDTTDIWLEAKGARLAVTWAGPHSNLILGGSAALVLVLWPEFGLNALLFQFAFLCYMLVFFNLNPLLELDGYYLLMDALEIPMLRLKSLRFIQTGLWDRFKEVVGWRAQPVRSLARGLRLFLASLSREEKIYTVFGLMSGAWTVYAIYLGAFFWQQRLAGALRDLWTQGGDTGKMILAAVTAVFGLIFVLAIGQFVLRFVKQAIQRAAARGLFSSTRNMAALLLTGAVLLAVLPAYLGYPTLAPLTSLAALTVAATFAGLSARSYAGSRLAPVFGLLLVFALALLLGEAIGLAAELVPGTSGLLSAALVLSRAVAMGALLLASLRLAANASLVTVANPTIAPKHGNGWNGGSSRQLAALRPLEIGLIALGLVASGGVAVWLASQGQAAGAPWLGTLLVAGTALGCLAALSLLVPTYVSYWSTRSGPAWVVCALSLAALATAAIVGLPDLLAYLLLAAGLVLHHLATRAIRLLRESPQASVDLSDSRRLERAFTWTASTLYAQVRQVAGQRTARSLSSQFNAYTEAAGWCVALSHGKVEDRTDKSLGLIDAGETYAAALSLLLDLGVREVGQRLAITGLQWAYDGLPWEEREIGAQYLFRHVKRAASLSREFESTQADYQRLLRRMSLFATMDQAEIDLLCARLQSKQVPAGRVIIHQGQRGDRFYVIRQGHVEVTQRDEQGAWQVVNQIDRGGYFGQVALLRDAPRNATCRATVPTELLSLSRQDFDQLVRVRFSLRDKVGQAITQAAFLRQMPLFAEMDGHQLQRVAATLDTRVFEPEEILIHQGETGETFFIIESGQVEVSVTHNGGQEVVAQRGPGEYVGEMALLLALPRTATVRAVTHIRTLTLNRADFERLVARDLHTGRGLERDASRRMLDLKRIDREGRP